jgi:hypothetical protein
MGGAVGAVARSLVVAAAMAGLSLIGGCSSDGDDSAAAEPVEAAPSPEAIAWCSDFVDSYWRIDSLNESGDLLDDPAAFEAAHQRLRTAWQRLAGTAPAEIRDEARIVRQGIDALAVDPEDEQASILYDDTYLIASERVERYVRDTCGFDLDDQG